MLRNKSQVVTNTNNNSTVHTNYSKLLNSIKDNSVFHKKCKSNMHIPSSNNNHKSYVRNDPISIIKQDQNGSFCSINQPNLTNRKTDRTLNTSYVDYEDNLKRSPTNFCKILDVSTDDYQYNSQIKVYPCQQKQSPKPFLAENYTNNYASSIYAKKKTLSKISNEYNSENHNNNYNSCGVESKTPRGYFSNYLCRLETEFNGVSKSPLNRRIIG